MGSEGYPKSQWDAGFNAGVSRAREIVEEKEKVIALLNKAIDHLAEENASYRRMVASQEKGEKNARQLATAEYRARPRTLEEAKVLFVIEKEERPLTATEAMMKQRDEELHAKVREAWALRYGPTSKDGRHGS